jgi:predicted RNA-binding Zn-ribbon protein involved in translation (DUF1610 family)/transposase-like protein
LSRNGPSNAPLTEGLPEDLVSQIVTFYEREGLNVRNVHEADPTIDKKSEIENGLKACPVCGENQDLHVVPAFSQAVCANCKWSGPLEDLIDYGSDPDPDRKVHGDDEANWLGGDDEPDDWDDYTSRTKIEHHFLSSTKVADFVTKCPQCGSDVYGEPSRTGAVEYQCQRCGWYHVQPRQAAADDVTDDKAPECPNCKSHSYDVVQYPEGTVGDGHLRCLNCGQEFTHTLYMNPKGSKVAMRPRYEQPNSIDLMRSAIIKALGLTRTNLEQNDLINRAIRDAQLDVTGTNHPDAFPHKALQSVRWQGVFERALEIASEDLSISSFPAADDPSVQEMWPDTVPPGWEDYYRDLKSSGVEEIDGDTIPDWFAEALQSDLEAYVSSEYKQDYRRGDRVETPWGLGTVRDDSEGMWTVDFDAPSPYGDHDTLSADELQLVGSMQKGSPYPEHSDKNAPDHSPPGQKLPKKVNSIYNACVREEKSGDEPSDDLQEKCMKIAWAQYKKMKRSSKLTVVGMGPPSYPSVFESLVRDIIREAGITRITLDQNDFIFNWVREQTQGQVPGYEPGDRFGEFNTSRSYRNMVRRLAQQLQATTVGQQARIPGTDLRQQEINENYQGIAPRQPQRREIQAATVVNDTEGSPLEVGKLYLMHSTKYKIPDLIRIVNVEPNQVEAHIDSDKRGMFPVNISAADYVSLGYSFEPYTKTAAGDGSLDDFGDDWESEADVFCPVCGGPGVYMGTLGSRDHYRCRNCGIDFSIDHETHQSKTAARKISLTPKRQKELIDENPTGRARNYDKLNLDGTHYQATYELIPRPRDDEIDSHFLW